MNFQRGVVRRSWLIVISLLVLTLGVLAAKPGYLYAKSLYSRHLANTSSRLLEAGDLQGALDHALRARQLSPAEPEAIRAFARALVLLGRAQEAWPFWVAFMDAGRPSPPDRLEFAELAVTMRQFEAAEQQMQLLRAESGDETVETLRMRAVIAASRGDNPLARTYVDRALALEPNNRRLRMQRATLLLGSADKDEWTRGAVEIGQLARGTDRIALDCLLLIANNSKLDSRSTETLVKLVREHPLANLAFRLRIVEVQIANNPATRDALMENVEAHVKSGLSKEDLLSCVVWLNNMEEYARAERLNPADQAGSDQRFFVARLNSLAGVGRWQDIATALSDGGVGLDVAQRELFLARVADAEGDNARRRNHLARAKQAALHAPEKQLALATQCEKYGWKDEAIEFHRFLTSNPVVAGSAFSALIRLHSNEESTVKERRDLVAELRKSFPKLAVAINDEAYLNFLLDENVQRSLEEMAKLVAAHREFVPFRSTLAFGLWRSGQADAALETLEAEKFDWREASNATRALYANLLETNGKTEEAQLVKATVDFSRLLPEERTLMQ